MTTSLPNSSRTLYPLVIPLGDAPMLAYRGWKVSEINGKATLVSPAHGKYFWGEETRALCDKCTKIIDFITVKMVTVDIGEDCSCGLYALKTPEKVMESYGSSSDIIGQVAMYGEKVIEGVSGFRASRMKVITLFAPSIRVMKPEVIEELAINYQCNIIKANDPLYSILARIRAKFEEAHGLLPYGRSIHNQNGHVSKGLYSSSEYWGERDTSYDFLSTGLNNQIDNSMHTHEGRPSPLAEYNDVDEGAEFDEFGNQILKEGRKPRKAIVNPELVSKSITTPQLQSPIKLSGLSFEELKARLKKK